MVATKNCTGQEEEQQTMTIMLCLVAVAVVVVVVHANTASVNTRGMSPSARTALEAAAKQNQVKCKNGKPLAAIQWNDGYCDCHDGSDEPGTSACAGVGTENSFFCLNAGYVSRDLSSLFVDDGICDCCDGSDEPRGRCADSCAEVGKEWRADLQQKIATVSAGAAIRAAYVADAKEALSNARSEHEQVTAQIAANKAKLDAAAAIKDSLEVREKLARRVLDARKAAEAPDDDLALPPGPAPPANADANADASEDDGEHRELENADEDDDDVLEDVEEAAPEPAAGDAGDAAAAEELHDEVFEKGPQDDATLNGYIDQATEAKNAWQTIENERTRLTARLDTLSELIEEDFGPDGAFYALKGKCYSFDTPEYKYELCPFSSVTQKQLTGHGGTSMGRWDGSGAGWVAGSNYGQLDFKGGQGCWQGPERSCRVFVSCGADNVLSDTQEPNKCEYTMKFVTPAACTPDLLESLQSQLTGATKHTNILHSEL
jgi:protein kinase C substrate 80K-H